jgi:glycosyltransferase involved in cell wall biosynthesis
MIQVSHFVGLSGVGGVQRNFIEYINNQIKTESNLSHKVYTLGEVDSQYKISVKVYNIRKINNLLSLILDITSKKKIVHFYNNLTSLKVAIFLFLLPVRKLILHERGTIWNFPSSRGILLRFVAWKAHLILANSNATKTMLQRKFHISHGKIRVLHNGINTKIKCSKKKSTCNQSPIFRVGFIGRLDTPKGAHVLIDAMQYMTDCKIELIIAGEGILKSALEKQAHNLENVSFIGRVENPYSFLSGLDLLVVPSIREPLGNVCLEAGLCKLPVLAANIDGIPEIIENKVSGELITPTQVITLKVLNKAVPLPEFVVDPLTQALLLPKQIDPQILGNKIITLSNSHVLLQKYGDQLYNKVIGYFNMDRYTSELYDIYSEVGG